MVTDWSHEVEMPARSLDTSITEATARAFLNRSAERTSLWCERIPGFHLLKTTRGGSWRYRYTDASGRRRVATVGRFPAMKPQEAAQRARRWRNDETDVLAEKARERREQEDASRRARQRTVRAYLEGRYADHQARKKTGNETLAIIRRNFPGWLDRDMATLTADDAEAWQVRKEAEGRAHVTLRRAFGAMQTMLRHAAQNGPLDTNPLDGVTLKPPTDDERAEQLSAERMTARRQLTGEEIRRLHAGLRAFAEEVRAQRRRTRRHGKPYLPGLDAVAHPHWFVPFAYCALHTGLRPGDIYSLRWAELDIDRGRLVNKFPEKTRHHREPANVTMDLTPELRGIMHAWWDQRGRPDSGLVFPSPANDRRMDKKAHGRPWTRVKELGGLPADLSFYALRHNFISTLVAAGIPLLSVAQMSGHKSADMVEAHYGHLCPSVAADAVAAVGDAVKQPAG